MGNFRNLRVWNEALDLTERIYFITNQDPFSRDYGLKDQIQRSAVSAASNIAEGNERNTNNQSVYYFNIASGSVAEVITQLHIANRIDYIDLITLNELEDRAEKIRASLKNLIKAFKA